MSSVGPNSFQVALVLILLSAISARIGQLDRHEIRESPICDNVNKSQLPCSSFSF